MDDSIHDQLIFSENNALKSTILQALLLNNSFQDSVNKVK